MTTSSDIGRNSNVTVDVYLCEVRFDHNSWVEECNENTLKDSAVPSIFQHISSVEYINIINEKLKSSNIVDETAERGMAAIDKLKAEGILGYDQTQNELIKFGSLPVKSLLQKLRIKQKSYLIAVIESETNTLSLG